MCFIKYLLYFFSLYHFAALHKNYVDPEIEKFREREVKIGEEIKAITEDSCQILKELDPHG